MRPISSFGFDVKLACWAGAFSAGAAAPLPKSKNNANAKMYLSCMAVKSAQGLYSQYIKSHCIRYAVISCRGEAMPRPLYEPISARVHTFRSAACYKPRLISTAYINMAFKLPK